MGDGNSLLLSNRYSRWYLAIVEKARSENRKRGPGRYYEQHHVLPKCLYPDLSKAKDNLVLLTAREHFVCHWLLTKMVQTKQHRMMLLHAFGQMGASFHKRGIIPSSWRYATARKATVIALSLIHKGKTISAEQREKLRIASTGLRHTADVKERISASKRGVLKSEETKAKVRLGVLEYNKQHGPANKGSHWTEESRERLKAKFKQFGHHMIGRKNPAPLVTCPHCGKTLDARTAGRWHFNNCKHRKQMEIPL